MAGSTSQSMVRMDDGVNLNVKILGDTPGKPLLITLHGAPGVSSMAEPEQGFGFLSDKFRVLVFDARGSGTSDHVGPYTHDRWIRDIEALRIWAKEDKIVLAGGSYGGFIALDYAIAHGDKLQGLILRGSWTSGFIGCMKALKSVLTSPRITVDAARQTRVWSGTLHDDNDYVQAIAEILPIYEPPKEVTGKSDEESREFEGGDSSGGALKLDSATQNAAFNKNMPAFDVRDRLQDIKVPTLVIVGRHDIISPVEYSVEISTGIPDAELVVFEKSGHNPVADEPERYQEVVSGFFKARVL